jgi:hypothetical protein
MLQGEVGDPGGVVQAGEGGPRPGDAGRVAGGPELEHLGQELRDGKRGGGDRGVVERVNHVLWPGFRGYSCLCTQNYADYADRLFLLYAVIDQYGQ